MRRFAILATGLALAACTSAASTGASASLTPTSTPTPRPSADLLGSFAGDLELEGGCFTVVDDAGTTWEVAWPDGYQPDDLNGEPVLTGPNGGVVARTGDRVALNGAEASGGSTCAVGSIFEATEVVYILSGN